MLINACGLQKIYTSGWYGREKVQALVEATLHIQQGETVGLIGRSGSGKSTLGALLAGLAAPTAGAIFYMGKPVRYPYKGQLRRKIQLLDQHPDQAFDPAYMLGASLQEVYQINALEFSHKTLLTKLEEFGLYAEHLRRYPSQLSGGELQRAALFRLLVLEPDLLVLDEPTSMLDVISQAQIIDLLCSVQRQNNTSYLFISHDLELVNRICHRIYRLTAGRIISGS